MFQQDTIFVWHIFLRIWHTCARVCAIYAPCFESHGTHVDHFLNTELDIFSKLRFRDLCSMLYISYLCSRLGSRVTFVHSSCAKLCAKIFRIIHNISLLLYNPIIYASG